MAASPSIRCIIRNTHKHIQLDCQPKSPFYYLAHLHEIQPPNQYAHDIDQYRSIRLPGQNIKETWRTLFSNVALIKFHFIELLNVVDFAINAASAEVYLLKREPEEGLYVYSEEKEKLMKLQYKYRSASSICFEDQHKRLYVSDDEGVHIYLVEGYM